MTTSHEEPIYINPKFKTLSDTELNAVILAHEDLLQGNQEYLGHLHTDLVIAWSKLTESGYDMDNQDDVTDEQDDILSEVGELSGVWYQTLNQYARWEWTMKDAKLELMERDEKRAELSKEEDAEDAAEKDSKEEAEGK